MGFLVAVGAVSAASTAAAFWVGYWRGYWIGRAEAVREHSEHVGGMLHRWRAEQRP